MSANDKVCPPCCRMPGLSVQAGVKETVMASLLLLIFVFQIPHEDSK
jgi:hypothetical protein